LKMWTSVRQWGWSWFVYVEVIKVGEKNVRRLISIPVL